MATKKAKRLTHVAWRPMMLLGTSCCSLIYSLAVRLHNNSRPKSPTKVETKGKITAIYFLWMVHNERMNGGESSSEEKKETFKGENEY